MIRNIFFLAFAASQIHAYQNLYGHLKTWNDFEQMEQRLHNEKIIDVSSFEKSSYKVKLITLESGIKALFKTGEYHYAEIAGYRLSKILNLLLVPPTIVRKIEGKQGSLQLYLPIPDMNSMDDASEVLKAIGNDVISSAKFFYYLAGQWDTHFGNQLVEKQEKSHRLWLVDNAAMLHRAYCKYGGITFIEQGTNKKTPLSREKDFPFDKAEIAPQKDIYDICKPYIGSRNHLRVLAREKELKYVIWKSTLWIEYPTEGPRKFGPYATNCPIDLLKASRKLTYKNLSQVWAELYQENQTDAQELIELILQRRDELLSIHF